MSYEILKVKQGENRVGSRLVPAQRFHAEYMAAWRRKYFAHFFTWIKPSTEDVEKWLEEYDKKDDDILFIVLNRPYHSETQLAMSSPVGQVGLYNITEDSAEFGRIVRGFGVPKDVMLSASDEMLLWAKHSLGIKKIYLDVFAWNHRAISLYQQLGFVVEDVVTYIRCTKNRIVTWRPAAEFAEFSPSVTTSEVLTMVLRD